MNFRDNQLEEGRFDNGIVASGLPMFEIGRLNWESAGISVPKRTATPKLQPVTDKADVFLPLQDIAQAMRMQWNLSAAGITVTATAGYQRTISAIENDEVWAARNASRYTKRLEPNRSLPVPDSNPNELQVTALLWPRGQVKRVVVLENRQLSFWQWSNQLWTRYYQANLKNLPSWLCATTTSRSTSFWAAIGAITAQLGQRPALNTDLTIHVQCQFSVPERADEINETQVFLSWPRDGRLTTRLRLALSIYDVQAGDFISGAPRVIDPKTGRPSQAPVPEDYSFMQEARIPKQ